MGGSNFELIMQEVLNQKQHMDELLDENSELRRQLTALRAGQGIIIEIEGIQFALGSETFTDPFPVQAVPTTPAIFEREPAAQATAVTVATSSTVPMGTIPETPYPGANEFAQVAQFSHKVDEVGEEEEVPPPHTSPFLEEMLLDEFASAATSPMAVWKAPVTRKLAAIDEDQNAALRKELIGSFLLE